MALDKTDKMSKLRPLVNRLNQRFQQWGVFHEDVCIDESMGPRVIKQNVVYIRFLSFTFSLVEERSFNKFAKWIPGYKLPTRKTLSNSLLQEVYTKCEDDVSVQLAEEVTTMCITTDLWTSRVTESYIAITGHYITKNFQFKTTLLGCCHFSGNHTSANIAEQIGALMDKWHLRKKINFAVTDNAANVVKAIKDLDDLDFKHFGCYAHTLNLIVEDALKPLKPLVDKVKAIVGHFKKSTTSSERLLKYQNQQSNESPKRLIQDIETRWNSTFYMIRRFVELEEAVRSTIALVSRELPILKNEEWVTLLQLCQILQPVEEVTSMMSGQNYLTGSYVIVITRCLKESYNKILGTSDLQQDIISVAKSLKLGLSERFKNIEQSGTFAISTFLDPRFKMKAFADHNEANRAKEKVRSLTASLISLNLSNDNNHHQMPTSSKKEPNELSPWQILDDIIEENTTQGTPLSKAIKEIDMYLGDDFLPRKNSAGEWNCPLEWWKNHRHVYPNLSQIFIKHSNIVATSVPCERMFSKSGLIVNQRRTRLTTQKVEKLMFLNINLDKNRF
ncbi:LOW QUALITY PROTEIN: uncharacterized protein LOC112904078 [Agrilus planipennis]|uniref:LOW QUALITY PROTEIN: uncharacterized protein LOC112904078 n=1 Tax=Agrilus planipennis TaxID=224129 RepID=A0A7F5R1R1_AGRPL|nr:LOW QUALITY PROTEIN: uncharacterized protein LOC112904078 [Agrilus planipennis]